MSHFMNDPVATVSFVDKERSTGPTAKLSQTGISHVLLDISRMDTILAAAPFSLSTVYINSLTLNDKQNFIRDAIRVGTIDALDLLPVAVTDAGDPTTEVHPPYTVWQNTTSGGIWQTPGDGTWLEVIP